MYFPKDECALNKICNPDVKGGRWAGKHDFIFFFFFLNRAVTAKDRSSFADGTVKELSNINNFNNPSLLT